MNSLDQKIFLSFLAAVFLSILSLMPQIMHQTNGFSGSAIVHDDEFIALARIKRSIQNEKVVCNHATYEGRNTECFFPDSSHRLLGFIAKSLDLTPEQMTIIARPFLTLMLFSLLLAIFLILDLKFGFAYFSALLCFLSPSAWYFKPLLSWLTGDYIFAFNHFTIPLVPLFVHLLTLLLLLTIFFSDNKKIKSIIASVALFGILFYLPFAFWLHLLFTLFIIALLDRTKRTVSLIAIITILAFMIGAPSLSVFLNLSKNPQFNWVMWRNGLGLNDHSIYLLYGKAMWLVALSSFTLFRKDHPISVEKRKIIGALYYSAFFLYLSPIIIGKTFLNIHFKYLLVPFSMLIIAQFFHYFFTKYNHFIPKLNWKMSSRTSFAMAIVLIIFAIGINASLRFYGESERLVSNKSIEDVKQSLNNLMPGLSDDNVFLANDKIMNIIPMIYGKRILRDSAAEISPNLDLLERHFFQWKFMGLSGFPLRQYINESYSLIHWSLGLDFSMENIVRNNHFRDPRGEFKEQLFQSLLTSYDSKADLEWQKLFYSYRIDYLVVTSQDQWDIPFISRYFKLDEVWSQNDITIYKLLPTRPQ